MDEEPKTYKIMPYTSSSSNSKNIITKDGICFGDFFEVWLVEQKSYLEQLNKIHEEAQLERLVGQVLSHYQHYYETKSKAASENVCLLFTPPWLSIFEHTLLWITGFKPGLAFQLMDTTVGHDEDLTAQQVEKIKWLKAETRLMENALSNELARIQEVIVGPLWMDIVGRMDTQIYIVDGAEADQVIGTIKRELRDLVVNADYLRATSARELVNILSPVQAAKFLAAIARFQLRTHAWGLQRDADRMASWQGSSF